jgi:hypothetical protein
MKQGFADGAALMSASTVQWKLASLTEAVRVPGVRILWN